MDLEDDVDAVGVDEERGLRVWLSVTGPERLPLVVFEMDDEADDVLED